MSNYIVFDIGGSSVKYAIMSEEGDFITKGSYKSERNNFELFKSIEHNCDECIYGIPAYMNMTINVHGPSKGVCLEGYYRPISTEKEFQLVKDSFLYAKEKAMELLKNKSTN